MTVLRRARPLLGTLVEITVTHAPVPSRVHDAVARAFGVGVGREPEHA